MLLERRHKNSLKHMYPQSSYDGFAEIQYITVLLLETISGEVVIELHQW